MKKKSIYVETSVISYLAARRSRNLVVAAWQEITSEFWDSHRNRYALFTSELVIAEASAGDPGTAKRRVDMLRGVAELSITDESKQLAAAILADGILPKTANIDALHIAVAAIHAIDYLLTWNCRHIDNPKTKPRVREICASLGYRCPEICTPLELTEG